MRDRSNDCPHCGDELPECECGAGRVIFDLESKLAEAVGLLANLSINRHIHEAGQEGDINRCRRCDKDLFDAVHYRFGESLATDQSKAAEFVAENGGAGG